MVLNELKELYEKNKEVKFKLFSLDYTIKEEDGFVIIYAEMYVKQKRKYNTLDELLNNFTIYNESILENIDRLIILK